MKLHNKEKIWQQQVSQLLELVGDRDASISRVELMCKQKCAALDQHYRKLADQEEQYLEEVIAKEESFCKELSENMAKAKRELSDLCTLWKAKEKTWDQNKKQLEERLHQKEKMWQEKEALNMEEIKLFQDGIDQPQVSCFNTFLVCVSDFYLIMSHSLS